MTGTLTDRRIAAAKPRAKPYRLSDGGGLLLVIYPGGAKGWAVRVFRVRTMVRATSTLTPLRPRRW